MLEEIRPKVGEGIFVVIMDDPLVLLRVHLCFWSFITLIAAFGSNILAQLLGIKSISQRFNGLVALINESFYLKIIFSSCNSMIE